MALALNINKNWYAIKQKKKEKIKQAQNTVRIIKLILLHKTQLLSNLYELLIIADDFICHFQQGDFKYFYNK